MKIALIGYGKMGKAIEEVALTKGHEITLKIDLHNKHELTTKNLQQADVAIEFTGPETAAENLRKCFDAQIPVVCGSTGWLKELDSIVEDCKSKNGTLLYSSNFSIGVNLFFELNKTLAELMEAHPEYNITVEETHHTQKKDAPSGTAISIAEGILEKIKRKNAWQNNPSEDEKILPIISYRIDPAPGTHAVKYTSSVDDIEIIHTAHNRTGFASGAILAGEYVVGKKGIFSMKDVLGFK